MNGGASCCAWSRWTTTLGVVVLTAGWAASRGLEPAPSGPPLVKAAASWVASLDDSQKQTALMDYDTAERVKWHFIPMDHRKGLQLKHMQPPQRKLALQLLQSCLSQLGYGKATRIMELEALLRELEKDAQGTPLRDPDRYYFTLFGKAGTEEKWGLSVEGHHLSLNFVIDRGVVISSTPAFFAANPAVVKNETPAGPARGLRVLADEEQLAFELLADLDPNQRARAVISAESPREIRAAGEPQPPQDPPVGLTYAQLKPEQQMLLRRLVSAYAANMPADLAQQRTADIEQAGWDKVHFAWAGAQQPGIGHYYRLQGPTFLIEFVNTQPDAAGNPANHIHCVWRDMRGDFALPISQH